MYDTKHQSSVGLYFAMVNIVVFKTPVGQKVGKIKQISDGRTDGTTR